MKNQSAKSAANTGKKTGTSRKDPGVPGKGKGQATVAKANSADLQELFEDMLKDIYWAEKALTKALPKMVKNATSEELVTALENHTEETQGQVEKLEQVFELLGKRAQAKKCEAMDGLIKEAEEMMSEADKGVMRDAAIIAAGQKVEHYEIASYGTMRAYAEILGLQDVAGLLEEILEEEKAADEKLTEVTQAAVVLAEEEGEEEDEDEDEK